VCLIYHQGKLFHAYLDFWNERKKTEVTGAEVGRDLLKNA